MSIPAINQRVLQFDLSGAKPMRQHHNTRRYGTIISMPLSFLPLSIDDTTSESGFDEDPEQYLDAESQGESECECGGQYDSQIGCIDGCGRDHESEADNSEDYDISDDDSQWEFKPTAVSSDGTSIENSTTGSTYSAAQEIAAKYRAEHPEIDDTLAEDTTTKTDLDQRDECIEKPEVRLPEPDEDSVSMYTVPSPLDSPSLMFLDPPKPVDDPKLRRRNSDAKALDDAEYEALQIIYRAGLNHIALTSIVCQRPGCYDTLHNLKALKLHLHIHHIDDEVRAARLAAPRGVACGKCGGRYECSRELQMHVCMPLRTRSRSNLKGKAPKDRDRNDEGTTQRPFSPSLIPLPLSPPMSPIIGGIRRVFGLPPLLDLDSL